MNTYYRYQVSTTLPALRWLLAETSFFFWEFDAFSHLETRPQLLLACVSVKSSSAALCQAWHQLSSFGCPEHKSTLWSGILWRQEIFVQNKPLLGKQCKDQTPVICLPIFYTHVPLCHNFLWCCRITQVYRACPAKTISILIPKESLLPRWFPGPHIFSFLAGSSSWLSQAGAWGWSLSSDCPQGSVRKLCGHDGIFLLTFLT